MRRKSRARGVLPPQHAPPRDVDFPHATELGVAIRGVAAGALIFEVVLSLQRRDVELPGLQGDQGG
jgi:hypothetical protein